MSFCPVPVPAIPKTTRELAEIVCVKNSSWYLLVSRELRRLYDALEIEKLYPNAGQWGLHPYQAFAFLMLQKMEGLSDRSAAAQVAVNIGWKYVLALTLDHGGWDPTVLVTARNRLLTEPVLSVLDQQLKTLAEQGLLNTTKQRLDATPIDACIKSLNRTELILETVRAAIEMLTMSEPDWFVPIARPGWTKTYYVDRPFNYRLPKKESERVKLAEKSGADGFYILDCIAAEQDEVRRKRLETIPQVQVLVQILEDQFAPRDGSGNPPLRKSAELRPSGERIISPHETDARRARKGSSVCDGYKLHTTETCVEGFPNFITDACIEPATTNDSLTLPMIVDRLRDADRVPQQLFVDSGYVNAPFFTKAFLEFRIKIVSRLLNGHSWQSQEQTGFDKSQFQLNFSTEQATCPVGISSSKWKRKKDGHIDVYFPKDQCSACPFRTQCTKASQRILRVQPQQVHEYQMLMRSEQETSEFKKEYSRRAGVEGTQAEIVRVAGRQSPTRGKAKTSLHYLLSCVGVNFLRLVRWQQGFRPAKTRTGKFQTLAVA